MEREFGAAEASGFVRRTMCFTPSNVQFDAAFGD
jgi:hypothetical protein